MYHSDYAPYNRSTPTRARAIKPRQSSGWADGPGSRFEGQSTSREDYSAPGRDAYAVSAPKPRSGEIQTPAVRFEGQTEAQMSYGAPSSDALRNSRRPPSRPIQHEGALAEMRGVPFEGSTETRDAFQKWDVGAQPSYKAPVAEQDVVSSAPFQGRSTAQDSYAAPPAESYGASRQTPRNRQDSSPYTRGAKFEGSSTSREDFRPPPRDALVVRVMACGGSDAVVRWGAVW